MAGEEGFEPPNGGSKGRCLTTWRLPNARHRVQEVWFFLKGLEGGLPPLAFPTFLEKVGALKDCVPSHSGFAMRLAFESSVLGADEVPKPPDGCLSDAREVGEILYGAQCFSMTDKETGKSRWERSLYKSGNSLCSAKTHNFSNSFKSLSGTYKITNPSTIPTTPDTR